MLSDKLQQEMMAAFDSQMNLNESDGKYKKKNIVDNGSEVIPNESDGKYETKDIGDDAPDFVAGEIISNEENMIENEEQYEIAHVSLDKGKRKEEVQVLPITEIQEVHKSPIFENIEYCLKIIAFPVDGEGHKWEYFNIVLQNNNGPCPLIAICNVLILRKEIILPQNLNFITNESLISILADVIVSKSETASNANDLNSIMNFLPKLHKGLDVNICFDGSFSFEKTPETLIFQFLDIPLCHGWLIDPEESKLYKIAGHEHCSYNRAVEKIISGQEAAEKLVNNQEHLRQRSLDDTPSNSITPSLEPRLLSPDEIKELETIVDEGLCIDQFLNNSASQLTYHGLSTLGTSLPPKSLSVLFRNNHFYTLYKHTFPPRESVSLTVQLSNWIGFDETDRANHQYELLTLVTDQGYQKDDQIIWETLSNMEGDSIFLNALFQQRSHNNMNPLLAAAKYVSRPLDIMMNDVPPSQNVYEEQLRVEDQIARQKIAVNQQKQLPKSTNVQETPRDEFSTAENIKEVKVDSLQEQSDRDMALALSIQMDQEEEARRDASRIMLSENTVPPEDNVPKDSKDKASCLLM